MPGKAADRFQPGDLVFAKMRGFPHWPARIARGEGSKKKVPVFFYGTHQTASIPTENIVTYLGNKGRYGKGVRIRGFTEGMWEIENTPRVGSKQKMSTSPKQAPIKAPKTQAKTVAVVAPGNKKPSDDGQQKTDTPINTRAEKRKKIGMHSSQDEPVQWQKTAPASPAVIPPASRKTRSAEEKTSSAPKSEREKTTEERTKQQEESSGRKRKKEDEETTDERTKQQEESSGRKRKKEDEGEKIKEVGVEEGKAAVRKTREVASLETDKVIHKEEVKGNEEEEGGVAVKGNEEETENSPGQDEERRRRLAARRESVLKSLQGLLTRRKGLRKQSLKPTRTPKNGAGGKKAEEKKSIKTGGHKRDRKTASKKKESKKPEEQNECKTTDSKKPDEQKEGKTTGGKKPEEQKECKTTGGKKPEEQKEGKTTGGKKPEEQTEGKTTDEKVERTKTEVKKLEGKKTESKKPEEKMEKKVERQKSVEAKKSELTRAEATRSAATRAEATRSAATRAEATRSAATRAEATRSAATRAEAERSAATRAEAERSAATRAEAERSAATRAEAERSEAKKVEKEKVERQQEEEPKSPQRGVLGDGQKTDSVAKLNTTKESLTDSTLHRIHGDIRISLKTDNPDISKCLIALDQLSMVYVTSQHVQRHSELITTLRKMRRFRSNQDVMDKASMLYNRFKNAFLTVNDKDNVISPEFLRSLLEEKEREEEERVERWREKQRRRGEVLQEVRRRMSQLEERRGGEKGVVTEKEQGLPEGLPEDGSSKRIILRSTGRTEQGEVAPRH